MGIREKSDWPIVRQVFLIEERVPTADARIDCIWDARRVMTSAVRRGGLEVVRLRICQGGKGREIRAMKRRRALYPSG